MDIFEILKKFGVAVDKDNFAVVDTGSGELMSVKSLLDLHPCISLGDEKVVKSVAELTQLDRFICLSSKGLDIKYRLVAKWNLDGSRTIIVDNFHCTKNIGDVSESLYIEFEGSRAGNSRLGVWADAQKEEQSIYAKELQIFEDDIIAFDIEESGYRRAGLYKDGEIDTPEMIEELKSIEGATIFAEIFSSYCPGILETVNRAKALAPVR